MTMIYPLPKKSEYLLSKGWEMKNLMLYHKDGIEIFFDNSTAVEIYKIGNRDERLADLSIVTLDDLMELVVKLSQGFYD